MKEYVKSIQPNCIVSGRIGNGLGEYMSTGDNFIPSGVFEGDWEVPATLNDTWGFKENDHNWKDPKEVLRWLLKINSRGGSYLLNVGPDGKGIIPKPSADILREVGAWLKTNGDAIYGTKAVQGYPYDVDSFFLTGKDYRLYVNTLAKAGKIFQVQMLKSPVKKAILLGTGKEVKFTQSYAKASDIWRVHITLPGQLPYAYYNTVALEIEDKVPEFSSLDSI